MDKSPLATPTRLLARAREDSKGLREAFKYGLIAASVSPSRPGPKSSASQGAKLGVKDAAKVMGRSDKTISAYLAAWNAAAADRYYLPR